MPRYIDADLLKQTVDSRYIDRVFIDSYKYGYNAAILDAVFEIEEVPTVDVEPVKHAHWITTSDGYTRCSRCRVVMAHADIHGVHKLDTKMLTYCFKCGAKMDEEVRG